MYSQNRYRELMRVSRQWRNLETLKHNGCAHDATIKCAEGNLAMFCATCPQPGINVSVNEVMQMDNPYVTRI
jgi:hypothetical protein